MKFILDHIFVISIVVLSGGALLWPVLAGRGKKASPLEVTQLINRGKTTVLDVRDTAEYKNGHLRDALHIPLAELDKRIAELDKSKGKTIVVICQSGARASRALKTLQAGGFDDALGLEGGLAAWQAAGLPTVK